MAKRKEFAEKISAGLGEPVRLSEDAVCCSEIETDEEEMQMEEQSFKELVSECEDVIPELRTMSLAIPLTNFTQDSFASSNHPQFRTALCSKRNGPTTKSTLY